MLDTVLVPLISLALFFSERRTVLSVSDLTIHNFYALI